jgi:transposase-like protein
MTPELLKRAGEALYGPRWQSALARDLGVSDRTIRRWVADHQYDYPKGLAGEIAALLKPRADELALTLAEIRDAMARE